MASERKLTEKQLDILHDHYKETFARIRDAEASRDRLFLVLIGLFALLSLEIGYPAALGGTLGTLNIAGGELNLQALPLPALLNITWVLTLAIGLRYCQTSILINRQYPYLHLLEETISAAVGGDDLYQREGKVYLRGYPLMLNVAWFVYGILFPAIVMIASALLVWVGICQVDIPSISHCFRCSPCRCADLCVFYVPGTARNRRQVQQVASLTSHTCIVNACRSPR